MRFVDLCVNFLLVLSRGLGAHVLRRNRQVSQTPLFGQIRAYANRRTALSALGIANNDSDVSEKERNEVCYPISLWPPVMQSSTSLQGRRHGGKDTCKHGRLSYQARKLETSIRDCRKGPRLTHWIVKPEVDYCQW